MKPNYSLVGRAFTGGSGFGGGTVLIAAGMAIGLIAGGTGRGAGGTLMSGELGAAGSGTFAPIGASFKPTGTVMLLRVVVVSACFCEVGCGIPEPGIMGAGVELTAGITGNGPPAV